MIDMSLYQIKGFSQTPDDEIIKCIHKLVKKYLDTTVAEFKNLGGGTFGVAYKVKTVEGKILVIKFYRIDGVNKTQVLEMQTLKKYSTAKIPEVFFLHDKTAEIGLDAVGMEFVEGVPCVHCDPKDYSEDQKRKLAEELTTALHSINSAKCEKYGFLDNPCYDNWLDFYKPFAKEMRDWAMENGHDPIHKMPRELLDIIEYSWQNFDRVFNQPISEASLIHNDLCVCNFMVDKETLALTSIIDPNRSMYADVEYELHNLTNISGNDFYLYETYRNKYPTSANCDVKIAFYALYNEIYYYIITRMSYEYIYPFMIKRLWEEMENHFARTE